MYGDLNPEVVFLNRDNINILQLQDDSAVPGVLADSDLTAATKLGLVFDNLPVEYDSSLHPAVISYTPEGKVTVKLGGLGLPPGERTGYFVVYDGSNPLGIRWTPDLILTVI